MYFEGIQTIYNFKVLRNKDIIKSQFTFMCVYIKKNLMIVKM